jgi:hypothetical protein
MPLNQKTKHPQPKTLNPRLKKHLLTWQHELENDPDKAFILHGISEGFSLIDGDISDISPAQFKNHTSATCPGNKLKVEKRILEEIEDGNYVKVTHTPRIVSALAAIEKDDGDVRIIHDLSRPHGQSLNDYATKDPCQYNGFSKALTMITPSAFLSKTDLRWAYRSVSIKKCQQILTGLEWIFEGDTTPTLLADCSLPFGCYLRVIQ